MSKQNKANKNNYNQAGRLTPDDMARERKKMQGAMPSRERVRATGFEPRRSATDRNVPTEVTEGGERASSQARSEREESE